jgi:hypothetical protein
MLVYETIAIDEPFSDILIIEFGYYSSDQGEFLDIARYLKNL